MKDKPKTKEKLEPKKQSKQDEARIIANWFGFDILTVNDKVGYKDRKNLCTVFITVETVKW